MMTIFWDKDEIRLTDYLAHASMMNSLYCASIIEHLCSAMREKRHSKINPGVLLFHDSAPVYKSDIVQIAIQPAEFIEINHPTYFLDITSTDYSMFSHLQKFMRSKNFDSDDETIQTTDVCLHGLDFNLFQKAYRVRVIAGNA